MEACFFLLVKGTFSTGMLNSFINQMDEVTPPINLSMAENQLWLRDFDF